MANRDTPRSFGFKCAWYALRSLEIDAVVSAFGLGKSVETTWTDGVDGVYSDKVFVTPPLGDWILVAGRKLFYAGHDPAKSVLPILTELSRVFGESQYFATHRVVEAHCWALARTGKLNRAFAYVGDSGEVVWNEGKPTEAELALGEGVLEFPGPDESQLMRIAEAWSVNPSELESNFTEPGLGRLGEIP